jgi:ribose transport system permease protein
MTTPSLQLDPAPLTDDRSPSLFAREWFSPRTNGLIVSFTVLFCVLAFRSETFLSQYTLFVLSRQVAFFVLIALSQAVCLVVGGMNLSVGAIGSIATVALGMALDKFGISGWLAVPFAVFFGLLSGLINGLLITRLKIDSFIVTLSMMFIYMGLRSGISGGEPYRVSDGFTFIGQGSMAGVPWVFVIAALVLVLMAVMYRSSVFGRHMLATGGNLQAARLSGIDTDGKILAAHVLSGGLAGLTAVLWASQLGSAAPETGDNWLIVSFAVAIIGGTGLNGGTISLFGIFLGAAIFMLIKHGLVELKVNPYFANAFLGLMILIAVVVDRLGAIWSRKPRA